MKTLPALMRPSDYTRVLRPLLPPHAFAPRPQALWKVLLHLVVIAAGYALLRHSSAWWCGPLMAVVIGHSLGCLAFFAHDVSHQSVVSHAGLRRALEALLWGLNLISPTLWKRIHNQTHHHETNTLRDPDRQFLRSEHSLYTWAYNRLFYPSRDTLHGNPLPFFHFVTYILRHLITALLPGEKRLPVVTHKPAYSARHRWRILLDLFVMAALQWLIWMAVGRSWWAYFWASPAAIMGASAVVMLYVFTNHFLNPLCDHTDPLVGSTSVIVPRWMDWLHDHFSYHTEHHLFPGMNPHFYPLVSGLLITHFPDRYHRITLTEAWRQLWKRDEFIEVLPVRVFSSDSLERN